MYQESQHYIISIAPRYYIFHGHYYVFYYKMQYDYNFLCNNSTHLYDS
jgi:hypothetical protein